MKAFQHNLAPLMVSFLFVSSLAGEEPQPREPIPEPRFDRIDYDRPQDYLELLESLGAPDRIRQLADTLGSDTPTGTLLAIGQWMNANLVCENQAAYSWRDFDRVLDTKIFGGCADHALVFGALARACGIPTVWVKTMDADWIREFRTTGTCTSWRGHVFLEVHLDGQWMLLDASSLWLYDDYDPTMRILPGGRYAYDKGGDPKTMILSTDWERWKEQTAAYFARFDLGKLPVGMGRPLARTVYIAADNPVWQAVAQRMHMLEYYPISFNIDFERNLARAKGNYLIVTCVGDRLVLPEPYHGEYLPLSPEELRERMEQETRGLARKHLDDGTRLLLIYGKDVDAVLEVVRELELDPDH